MDDKGQFPGFVVKAPPLPPKDRPLSGSGAIYGSVIAKSITMSGSSDIYYDLDLTPLAGSAIALVK